RTASGGSAVDPEGEISLPALREDRHQQRERGRGEQRAAEPLHRAEGDQRTLGPRQAAQERARSEQRQTGHEEPAATEQIGESATQKQGAAAPQRRSLFVLMLTQLASTIVDHHNLIADQRLSALICCTWRSRTPTRRPLQRSRNCPRN